jgi:hypothetical protein
VSRGYKSGIDWGLIRIEYQTEAPQNANSTPTKHTQLVVAACVCVCVSCCV